MTIDDPQKLSELKAAADALCKKLRLIHDDPLYKGIWVSAHVHGLTYENGPKYDKELEALEQVLLK